jgi:hypothetical protein
MMAALQGANVVGADTRCMSNGTSSLSAFIRIARPNDTIGGFYCDLNVPSVPEGMEPIDSLQTLFDAWLGTTVSVQEYDFSQQVLVYPNPATDQLTIDSRKLAAGDKGIAKIELYNLLGYRIMEIFPSEIVNYNVTMDISVFPDGVYFIAISHNDGTMITRKLIIK